MSIKSSNLETWCPGHPPSLKSSEAIRDEINIGERELAGKTGLTISSPNLSFFGSNMTGVEGNDS